MCVAVTSIDSTILHCSLLRRPRSISSTAIDTMKTVLQVDSVEGFRSLIRRLRNGRIDVLFQGATATCVAAILGHYPWVSREYHE